VKAFFITLLLASIVFPVYSFITSMRDFAHNQWKRRSERLEDTTLPKTPSAHLGLTASQLAGLDELVIAAYKDAVYDGFRLGSGYQRLSLQTLGLDVLLFIASLVGLRACQTRSPSNQTMQPTAGRSDA
jgi:hypothetical protein